MYSSSLRKRFRAPATFDDYAAPQWYSNHNTRSDEYAKGVWFRRVGYILALGTVAGCVYLGILAVVSGGSTAVDGGPGSFVDTPKLNFKRSDGTGYICDVATCKTPNCTCASRYPPAGIEVANVPQFMVLTFEDPVMEAVTFPQAYENIVRLHSNPNGCPIGATWFTTTDNSDYHSIQVLDAHGVEIASHTMTHAPNPNISEIEGHRLAIQAYAGIPKSKIVGFRAPFLKLDKETFALLKSLDFWYDASVRHPLQHAYWPYTLDHGLAVSCDKSDSATCPYDPDMKFEGLWELPLTEIYLSKDKSASRLVDPPFSGEQLLTVLQSTFKRHHWEDKRAPMGIWMTPAWLLQDESRIETINHFIEWTQQVTNKQVYYITAKQLIQWMRYPSGLDRIKAHPAMQCVPPKVKPGQCNGMTSHRRGKYDEGLINNCVFDGYAFNTCFVCPKRKPTPDVPVPPPQAAGNESSRCISPKPSNGCMYGSWKNCACVCQISASGQGYCVDTKGMCTIPNEFDTITNKWQCPEGSFPSGTSPYKVSLTVNAQNSVPNYDDYTEDNIRGSGRNQAQQPILN
ncbi:uncharacterized protein BJ171DRAFT_595367 [Polychytrium aggregatum]|uniref:uncharacterized protein n=1 Tax=Polychytrium aggregatum TaxID=110093 RepID=UPI0022FE0526|nr:uncharacterized protein BJ171DRAFT_595367 [Polychytrium aggregatum]KAI9208927.1 hypothetical protein BJ171DRAFT_595367 [Polychytrium aggregatum]